MRIVQNNMIAASRFFADGFADGHFSRERDDGDFDFFGFETLDGFKDVAGVAGGEGAKDDEDLAGAMGGDVPKENIQIYRIYIPN
jgi:hypothetical protein